MKRFDQKGVAAVTVLVIIAVSIGGTVGVPIAVDVIDVDPDHPLYALERLGERIRMIGDEDQMQDRCIEAYRMYERGKAEAYLGVFNEFVEKIEVLLAKPKVKERVKAWLKAKEQYVGVVTDIYDVDPDHPLYEYEKKGELIRGIEPEELMKERWGEYGRLVDRGKGSEYKDILEEFAEKMHSCVPRDVGAKQEVVQWMQDQMPGIGQVRLKLWREMLEKCKEDLPELEEELEDEIGAIEGYELLPTLPPELWEEIRAHLQLIKEKVEEYCAQIYEMIAAYFDVDNVLADVDIYANVEINISVEKPLDLPAEFEKLLDDFEVELAKIEAELEGAAIELEVHPGEFKTLQETRGLYAVERLVKVAKDHKEKAEAAFDGGKLREALSLIHAAKVNLRQAEEILKHALEWEEEHSEIWEKHFQRFENLKEELEENLGKEWAEIVDEHKEKLEELKQKIMEELEKWKKRHKK